MLRAPPSDRDHERRLHAPGAVSRKLRLSAKPPSGHSTVFGDSRTFKVTLFYGGRAGTSMPVLGERSVEGGEPAGSDPEASALAAIKLHRMRRSRCTW